MNWIFEDEDENIYVGAAGHCTSLGRRMGAPDVGTFGTTVMRVFNPDFIEDDFALILVDEDKQDFVDPSLCRFGGAVSAAPFGAPGTIYRHYGWGAQTRHSDDERARSGTEVVPPTNLIVWEGRVSGGDSGSPVMSASGLAMGHATRVLRVPLTNSPDVEAGLAFGVSLSYALELAGDAGYDVTLMPGGLPRAPLEEGTVPVHAAAVR